MPKNKDEIVKSMKEVNSNEENLRFDELLSALRNAAGAQNKESILDEIFSEFGDTLSDQFYGFFNAPADSSIECVSDWMEKNLIAAKFFMNPVVLSACRQSENYKIIGEIIERYDRAVNFARLAAGYIAPFINMGQNQPSGGIDAYNQDLLRGNLDFFERQRDRAMAPETSAYSRLKVFMESMVTDQNRREQTYRFKELQSDIAEFSPDLKTPDAAEYFWDKNEYDIRRQMRIFAAGPAGNTPEYIIEWISRCPAVFAATRYAEDILRENYENYSPELGRMASDFFDVFSDPEGRRAICQNLDPSNVGRKEIRSKFRAFAAGFKNLFPDREVNQYNSSPSEFVKPEAEFEYAPVPPVGKINNQPEEQPADENKDEIVSENESNSEPDQFEIKIEEQPAEEELPVLPEIKVEEVFVRPAEEEVDDQPEEQPADENKDEIVSENESNNEPDQFEIKIEEQPSEEELPVLSEIKVEEQPVEKKDDVQPAQQSSAPQNKAPLDMNAISKALKDAAEDMNTLAADAEKAVKFFNDVFAKAKGGLVKRAHIDINSKLADIYAIARQKQFGKAFAERIDEKLKTELVDEFSRDGIKHRSVFGPVACLGKVRALRNIIKDNQKGITDPKAADAFKEIFLEALESGSDFFKSNAGYARNMSEFYHAGKLIFGADVIKSIDDALAANKNLSRTFLCCRAYEVESLSKDNTLGDTIYRSRITDAFKALDAHEDEFDTSSVVSDSLTRIKMAYVNYPGRITQVEDFAGKYYDVSFGLYDSQLGDFENRLDNHQLNPAAAARIIGKLQGLAQKFEVPNEQQEKYNELYKISQSRFGRELDFAMEDPVDYHSEDWFKLNDSLKDLEKAKTSYNSGEYKKLISMVRELNDKELGPWIKDGDGLTRKQNHAAKLLTIKTLIDGYIKHKAEDGVKKNTYHKLAAVESLNKFVTARLNELKPQKFANEPLSKLNATIDNLKLNVQSNISKDNLDPVVVQANEVCGAATDVTECRDCLECMDRIIKKAESSKTSNKEYLGLLAMQKQFRDYPGDADISEYKSAGYLVPEEVSQKDIKNSEKTAEELLNIDKVIVKYAIYDSLRRKGMSYGEKEKLLLMFANKTDLKVKVYHGKKDGTISIGSAQLIEEMQGCAKEADNADEMIGKSFTMSDLAYYTGEREYWDNAVADDMKAIEKGAKNLLPKYIDAAISKINTDKDLVQNWPELNLAVKCYNKVFDKPHDKQQIIERFEQKMSDLQKSAKSAEIEIDKNKANAVPQNV